jgi:putative chitinase
MKDFKTQLQKIFPETPKPIIDRLAEPLWETMEHYSITTLLRKAAFLAQIGHESGRLRYKEELASGAAYDTGKLAKALGNTPQKDGDGQRFKGRGLIQITGKANYTAFSKAFSMTINEAVDYLKTDLGACMSAGWYWNKRKLNALADEGKFKEITKKINGGLNGYEDRKRLYVLAKKVFGMEKELA